MNKFNKTHLNYLFQEMIQANYHNNKYLKLKSINHKKVLNAMKKPSN